MENNLATSAMSASLLAQNVYCVCFTERDGAESLQGELAQAREKFFAGGRKTVRVRKRELLRGFGGKLQGKLSRRGFYWRKTVRMAKGGRLSLEEAFQHAGGWLLVTRGFDRLIVSRVFFDQAQLWLKSEYYEPWNPRIARIIFKPVDSGDCIERFDWDTTRKLYRSTLLYPVPYLPGTSTQSLLNAQFGEPSLLVSTPLGTFCYCPQAEAEARRSALQDSPDEDTLSLLSWEPPKAAALSQEEPAPVRFTTLEEYAQLDPQPQAAEETSQEKPAPAGEEEPGQAAAPLETQPEAEEETSQEEPTPAAEEEPGQATAPLESQPEAAEETSQEEPAPAAEGQPCQAASSLETQPEAAEEPSQEETAPAAEEEPCQATSPLESQPEAEEEPSQEKPAPAPESPVDQEGSPRWREPEDPVDRAILQEARQAAGEDNAPLGEGASYQGGLREGKPWGRGRLEQPGGATAYEGEFQEGLRHGFGVSYYQDGNVCYAGSWKEGRRDGLGVSFRASDHALHISGWRDGVPGEFVSLFDKEGNLRYGGRMENGRKQGPGVSYNTADGTVFVGQWDQGQPTGMGSAFDREGRLVYYGHWKDGKRHGRGAEFAPDGSLVFEGEWKEGRYYNGVLYQKREASGLPGGSGN